jgi:uncharacterized membrane protein YgaE (UPF0421/DUF939 family)
VAGARVRVLTSLKAILLACTAAALAWWVAHDVLGHPQPFFAPVAAAISLTSSRLQTSARIGQMVGGVLIGIVTAEALHGILGSGPFALALIALTTMVIARAVGGGFLGDGVFFVNQAVGSAILVVALDRTGAGGDRLIDALVGGAIAYLIGGVLLPLPPVTELDEARQRLITRLRGRLDQLDRSRRRREGPELGRAWVLDTWAELEDSLTRMAVARRAAHLNSRVFPRWWRRRGLIEAEIRRSQELELLAVSAFAVMRHAVTPSSDTDPLDALRAAIADADAHRAPAGEAVGRP